MRYFSMLIYFNFAFATLGFFQPALRAEADLQSLFAELVQTSSLAKRDAILQANLGNYRTMNVTNDIPTLVKYFKGSDEYLSVKAGLILIGLCTFQSRSLPVVSDAFAEIEFRVDTGSVEQKKIAMVLIEKASVPLSTRSRAAIESNLYCGNPETEMVAIQTLSSARPVEASSIQALLMKMDSYDQRLLPTVIRALGATGDSSDLVIERLANELRNSNESVRQSAAEVLGEIGSPAKLRSEAALKRLIVDPETNDLTRQTAAFALKRIERDRKPLPR